MGGMMRVLAVCGCVGVAAARAQAPGLVWPELVPAGAGVGVRVEGYVVRGGRVEVSAWADRDGGRWVVDGATREILAQEPDRVQLVITPTP